jgi:trk system potassium uptake protein TrkH
MAVRELQRNAKYVDHLSALSLASSVLKYISIPLVLSLVLAVYYTESVVPFVVAMLVVVGLTALLVSGAGLTRTPVEVAPIVGELEPAIRQAVFRTVAIVTTTGYASMEFNAWSDPTKTVLLFAMFLGGSVGSAAGGIKIVRRCVIYRYVDRELFKTIHPEAIRPLRVSGNVIDEDAVTGLIGFTLLFLLLFAVSTALLYVDATRAGPTMSGLDATSVRMATLGNVGPGFGPVGPMNSYLPFSAGSKLFMVFLMWTGRLEIVTVLVILTPSYWRS